MKPENLLFAETHEWVEITEQDGQKIATIGLSAFALEQLTDLVFIELPEVGTTATARQEFGEVESVKAVSSLYSPVDGEVVEVNQALPDQLETLSDDPYGSGWFAKIRLTDENCLSKLVDHKTYEQQCAAGEM